MNGIYGKCEANYQSKGPICYVDQPSNCTDLKFSSEAGAYYSWEACGNNHIFILKHQILFIIIYLYVLLLTACLTNFYHIAEKQAIPISTLVGYWVQSTGNQEIICSQVSNSVINCFWTDILGKVVAQNVTIQGMSLSLSSNKGHHSGNGVIIWENGDRWEKQGRISFSIHIDDQSSK